MMILSGILLLLYIAKLNVYSQLMKQLSSEFVSLKLVVNKKIQLIQLTIASRQNILNLYQGAEQIMQAALYCT